MDRIAKWADSGVFILAIVIATVALCALVKCEAVVEADAGWPVWTPEERLDVGRCMMAEDSVGTDWPAIGHCLVKQWRSLRGRRTFRRQVREYCALFSKLSPRWQGKRPDRIRRSTWEAPLGGEGESPEAVRERWQRLRVFVDRFADREVDDPCPSCRWWGGPRYDQIPATWTCPLGPPETANIFCLSQK